MDIKQIRKEKGYTPLYPLKLTPNQTSKLEDYCLEQDYYLSFKKNDGTPAKFPMIENISIRKRVPIQLRNGKLVALDGNTQYDLYKLAEVTKVMVKYRTHNGNVKLKDNGNFRSLLKIGCIDKLEEIK